MDKVIVQLRREWIAEHRSLLRRLWLALTAWRWTHAG